MQRTVFESEVYARNRGVFPFKIIIEESLVNGFHTVDIMRIEYRNVAGKIYEEKDILNRTFWKEEERVIHTEKEKITGGGAK